MFLITVIIFCIFAASVPSVGSFSDISSYGNMPSVQSFSDESFVAPSSVSSKTVISPPTSPRDDLVNAPPSVQSSTNDMDVDENRYEYLVTSTCLSNIIGLSNYNLILSFQSGWST